MKVIHTLILTAVLAVVLPAHAQARDEPAAPARDEAKELSGMSIMGNKEAPKSLFIVPWKSSEIGVETGLTSRLLNETMQVVDKDVFERELDFYSSTVK